MRTRASRRGLDRGLRGLTLSALACAALVLLGLPARAADDLEAYRERFRLGYDKYMARDFAGAIVEWEAIYRELGAGRGYRLAFNLARAYDAYGDATRAAEGYESYVDEVTRRRATGDALEPIVLRQAEEASARLLELAKSRGRVKVTTKGRPIAVQVDSGAPRVSGFTAYVAPGAHTVTFNPGTREEARVDVLVAEGELKVVEAREPEPAATMASAARDGAVGTQGGATGAVDVPPRGADVLRPFPAWVLYVGGGATVASVIVPILYYEHASTVFDRMRAATNDADQTRLKNDYLGARSDAYASWAVPSVLAAATLGLTAYYFWGSKESRVEVAPSASFTRDGAHAGIVGRF